MNKKMVYGAVLILIGLLGSGAAYFWNAGQQKKVEKNNAATPKSSHEAPSVIQPVAEIKPNIPAQKTPSANKENESTASDAFPQEQEPPPEEVFDAETVKGVEGLKKVIPENLAKNAWAIFQAHSCDDQNVEIFSKEGKSEILIVSTCHRVIEPATEQTPARMDVEYPVMVSAARDAVFELKNLSGFGFMYQWGRMKGVTDLNNNGHVELWLEGTVYECDGEDEQNDCNGDGTQVAENFDGQLQPFKP